MRGIPSVGKRNMRNVPAVSPRGSVERRVAALEDRPANRRGAGGSLTRASDIARAETMRRLASMRLNLTGPIGDGPGVRGGQSAESELASARAAAELTAAARRDLLEAIAAGDDHRCERALARLRITRLKALLIARSPNG